MLEKKQAHFRLFLMIALSILSFPATTTKSKHFNPSLANNGNLMTSAQYSQTAIEMMNNIKIRSEACLTLTRPAKYTV